MVVENLSAVIGMERHDFKGEFAFYVFEAQFWFIDSGGLGSFILI